MGAEGWGAAWVGDTSLGKGQLQEKGGEGLGVALDRVGEVWWEQDPREAWPPVVAAAPDSSELAWKSPLPVSGSHSVGLGLVPSPGWYGVQAG